jgi:hypothetical protein
MGPARRAILDELENTRLRSLEIVFRTKGDSGAWKVTPLVELVAEDGRLLAYSADGHQSGVTYGDDGVHTMTLQIQGVVKPGDVQGAVVKMRVQPDSAEKWDFNWYLDYEWSGQEKYHSPTFANAQLGRDQNEHSWAVVIPS